MSNPDPLERLLTPPTCVVCGSLAMPQSGLCRRCEIEALFKMRDFLSRSRFNPAYEFYEPVSRSSFSI